MDVIREVLIRGRMEIVKADLAVPDITAFTKQLEQQNAFAQQQAKFLDELIARQKQRDDDAARAAAVDAQRNAEEAKRREESKKAAEEAKRIRQEQAAAAKAAADAEKARAAAELAAAKAAEQGAKEAAEAVAAAEKAKQDAIDATNRARDDAIRKDREINDALLKGGDALKQAGDGAFAFARGLTLIGLEGKSLEQVAQQVARVQGQFDLFRGGIDLIKGGIESARAFGKAMELAGGGVALLTTRMAALAAFLGPAGIVAIAAGALTAAVIYLFQSMGDETEDFIGNSEKRLVAFVGNAERAAAQAQAAFDRQDAIRDTLSGQSKIDAINADLASVKPGQSVEAIIEKERQQYENLFNREGLTEEELAPERERITTETLAAFDATAEEKRRRQQLGRDLLSATGERDQGADRERETAIREAQRVEEETQRTIQQKQDELRRAEEQAAAQERAKAVERAQLSAADQAFVSRTSGNLGDATVEQLKRLQSVAPAQFGQDVTDELTRRGGGQVAERTDAVAELKEELSALTQTLKEQSESTKGLRSADAAADAEAEAGAEKIRSFLRSIAKEIEQIEVERQKTESFYREGNG